MTHLLEPLLKFFMPLTCSLVALVTVVLLPVLSGHVKDKKRRALFFCAGMAILFGFWHFAAYFPSSSRWLRPLGSPIVGVYMVVILPAVCVPRGSIWRRFFLVVPVLAVLTLFLGVFDAYRSVPGHEQGFYWFLIRPVWLLAGSASLLILLQPFLSMKNFRFMVRSVCFVVLVYGGFMFRKDYLDYREMLSRRGDADDIMMISETVPVMRHDWRMLHLPSAPCRFTADGGYIQGCNMELFQRVLQMDFGAVLRKEPGAVATFSVIMGSLTLFFVLCFISARWMCGWLCPLSAIGGIMDWLRKKLGLPHLKPAQPVKITCLGSGLGIAGITLAMARVYPRLDADGRFMGCKIPVYPFCKICPSQQLCPVMAGGVSAYPGLPGWEWGSGFFMTACLALLVFFSISFTLGRRLWCRFCPMGMVSGLFNRGGCFKLVKSSVKCNGCGVCRDVCPMDIDYVRDEMIKPDVSSFDCVLCLKCIEKCPKDGCLSLEHVGVKITESRLFPKNEKSI